ncbi:histidine phosphatase family protein [Mangrovimonas sp. TPBH4]|uniref:SixA phosphatase family protein n=1 Tax=Mangrovimonas sp. TPBH4 TaxID=1645914 RepID=UPI0006B5AE74|nr:phosphoglycerate mutase family protein [Mangrovimonas sp. TPBH4]
MKEIVFVRHAKSSWDGGFSDLDRPLSTRGINDIKLVSNHYKPYNYMPDMVFSSPANRAFTTCKGVMAYLNLPENKLKIVDDLYDFGGEKVMSFIRSINGKSIDKIMIFGHNHALTSIVNDLGDQFIGNLPTCGLVKIDFYAEEWKFIAKGHTDVMIFPRDLKP